MIKYNHNFAKPDTNMRPLYGPIPLAYDVPHHEEWDEPVIDPETGEPTGETEHKSRDWTEHKIAIHPSAAEYLEAGYKPLRNMDPGLHEEGKHWERTGKIVDADTYYFWEYTLVDDPPPPPRRWSRLAIETALAQADMLDEADAYLTQVAIVGKLTAARAFSRCDYIEEGYPNAEAWNALLNGAADALGKTRAEIDAFLDAIPTEG